MSSQTFVHAKAPTPAAHTPVVAPVVRPLPPIQHNVQATPDVAAQLARATRLGHHADAIAVDDPRPLTIQPKLRLAPVGDKFEQEADHLAHVVVQRLALPRQPRMGEAAPLQRQAMVEDDQEEEDPLQAKILQTKIDVQRQAVDESDEELVKEDETSDAAPDTPASDTGESEDDEVQMAPDLQRQALDMGAPDESALDEEGEETVQAAPDPRSGESQNRAATVGAQVETLIRTARGTGQPLASGPRARMEAAFGTSFSSVKIHSDTRADTLNKSLRARAFTTGQDIFFRQGEFSPDSTAGQELLAHELTHVLQQGSRKGALQRARLDTMQVPAQHMIQTKPAVAVLATLPEPEVEAVEARDTEPEIAPTEASTQEEEQTPGAVTSTPATAPLQESPTGQVTGQIAEDSPEQTTGEPREQTTGTIVQSPEGQADFGETVPVEAATRGGAAPLEATAFPNAVTARGANDTVGAVAAGAQATEQARAAQAETEAAASQVDAPLTAEDDPDFQAVVDKVKRVAMQQRRHAPAKTKAQEAQSAAVSPPAEISATAQSNQVDQMDQADTPAFDAAAFKAELLKRIDARAPQTAKAADDFKESDTLGPLKNELQGHVAQERAASQAPMAATSAAVPDTSAVAPKAVTPLPSAEAGALPPEVGAAQAVPKPLSPARVESPMQAASANIDQTMTAAGVTEAQLADANEPEFTAALEAKQGAQVHAQLAPEAYRELEKTQLGQAAVAATQQARSQTRAMHADRAQLLKQVEGKQGEAKHADEQKRAEVGAHIQAIYAKTKGEVEGILNALDGKVNALFEPGATEAKQTFENYVEAEVEAYKDERYEGISGKVRAVTDFVKLTKLPPEVDAIYQTGRQRFLAQMGNLIDQVVVVIGQELTRAKQAVATGKREIAHYVSQLPKELQQTGNEASQAIQGQFLELEQGVDAKQGELIDTLAEKYQTTLHAVDARITEFQEANKTLFDLAGEKLAGVFGTILQLKELLTNVLARASAAIPTIIADPIAFLNNLVAGVKQGLSDFVDHIGTHLQGGLIEWLTGAITGAGIALPENWDLAGIFQLVMQLLGLGFEKLIGKVSQLFGFDVMSLVEPVQQVVEIYQTEGFTGLVKAGLARIIGEENMQSLLQVWEMIQSFISGNWDMLWSMIQEHLANLKEMVFGKIEEFISEGVIKAGITWIISLLNPAGAFIKACKAIYDIVMFFVERGSQVATLVNSIIDSVGAIAGGNLKAAAGAIENALVKAIPVAIGFLSSLLSIGNVSEKVQEIIKGAQGLVDKGLNAIFNSRPVQMVVGFIKKLVAKVKSGLKAGVDWAKGKMGIGGEEQDDRTDEEKTAALSSGVTEAETYLHRFNGRKVDDDIVKPQLDSIKARYGLKVLKVVAKGEHWAVHGEVNPILEKQTDALVLSDPGEAAALFQQLAVEAEQEFFDLHSLRQPGPMLLSPQERQMARAVGRGGGRDSSSQIEGISSREYIHSQTRITEAYSRMGPGGAISAEYHGTSGLVGVTGQGRNVVGTPMMGYERQYWGDVNVSGSQAATASQPLNRVVNWLGRYDEGGRSITAVTAEMRQNGMTDSAISQLIQGASATGHAISTSDLQAGGHRGTPDMLQRHRSFLLRLTQLTARVEPMRFMQRGIGQEGQLLQHQPVGLATAMGHELVQSGATGLASILSGGDLRSGMSPEEERSAPIGLNPVALRGSAQRDVAIVGIIERVRSLWSAWKASRQEQLLDVVSDQGVVNPQLVPTKAEMMRILTQFFGEARQ